MSARPVKGLVLAGGKGTRLRPLTHTMAKQLVPVANQPILVYAVNNLVKAGITEIAVIISPETGDAIQAVLNMWCPPGVSLTYILQDAPKGLAHAVKIAQDFMADSPFLMYLGDNLIQMDLSDMIAAFQADQAAARILLKPVQNPQAFGVGQLDAQGNIVCLEEKPKAPKSNLALVGVYLFSPQIFAAIDAIQPSPRGELEITDAIQKLIDQDHTVNASILEGWWLDTGKKDDLLEANRVVLDAYCQGTVEGEVDAKTQLRGRVDVGQGAVVTNSVLQGPVTIAPNCRISNAYIGPYTSIGEGSSVQNAEVENSVILSNCQIHDLPVRVEQSLIGNGCTISRSQGRPATHRFLLSDHAAVEIV